jgi:beta-glucosidase
LVVPSERLRPETGSPQHGLRGEYFQGRELAGPPLRTRIDRNVDFDFDESAPIPELGKNNYSIRWSGVLLPQLTGEYQFGAAANDGFRVFLDGKKIVDDWRRHDTETKLVAVHLVAGREYAIAMEYFQAEWSANAQLLWIPPNLKEEALTTANQADAVVMALGISPRLEGEEMAVEMAGFAGGDRTSLDLPAPQQALLEAIAATGKPLVVVLLNGSGLAVNWARQHADAILEAWYPGEEGGTAIADTLAGDKNPAGRLPVTFYKSVADLPPFTDYSMRGRTYRYFAGDPLYRFGDGLSYSKFKYGKPEIRIRDGGAEISVQVENDSGRDGDEVVQVYLSAPPGTTASNLLPIRKLVAFARVPIQAHQVRTVALTVPDLTGVNAQGEQVALSGPLHFDVGGHQPGLGAVGVDFILPGVK